MKIKEGSERTRKTLRKKQKIIFKQNLWEKFKRNHWFEKSLKQENFGNTENDSKRIWTTTFEWHRKISKTTII